MGWFDEQIKERINNDNDSFSEAFYKISGVVMHKNLDSELNKQEHVRSQDAIHEILKYYHIKPQELPGEIKDVNDQLEYFFRPSGIMRRVVVLSGTWYVDSAGPLLGRKSNGSIIALIPNGTSGYTYFDTLSGKRVKVTKSVASEISEEAICFYKPFPIKKIGISDLVKYIMQILSVQDFVTSGIAAFVMVIIGMFLPYVNSLIFSDVVSGHSAQLLLSSMALLFGATLSAMLIGVTKTLILARMESKINISLQSAAMMRLLSLPTDFFKKYGSGELANRIQSMNALGSIIINSIVGVGLTSIFSIVYIGQIFRYAAGLVFPAVMIIFLLIAFSVITAVVQARYAKEKFKKEALQSNLVFSLFSGIQKVKLSGAEKRAFAKWADRYKEVADTTYNPPSVIKFNSMISLMITLFGTIVLYYAAVRTHVSVSDYMAFNVSYGMVSGAFLGISNIAFAIANIKSIYELNSPILQTLPEISTDKKVVTRLTGAIEMNNVSFKYADDMPMILDNISLKIRPGQYVAIVGKTGCGKSTLMRLLLGFETASKGAVYYDGKDVSSIDLKSLRRNIGVVMQNGKLFSGDVFTNITISAPNLTMEQAWKAAEMAGVADDIRNMPMGMHTLISEGSGGVSGGQRQRLMIARAIAPKPKILMFDEATSALDNITQKIVSDSLEKLKCTRIVIAHRLSTIKQCDRIIVLDKGKIIEDGNYEELIKQDGFFAELVKRQQIDSSKV